MTARLAVVGTGMMGEALARGLLASGWEPTDLVLSDVRIDHVNEVGRALGIAVCKDAADATSRAEATLIAVKPQDAPSALDELAGRLGPSGLISIVAGLRTSVIEDHVGDAPVVRAMPNTPARVGKGATALCAGSYATKATKALATAIFESVGPVVWLDEAQLDAVTAVSGSGPAYVFYLAEAMIDAAVGLGLPRDVAETLTRATIEGAGTMLAQLEDAPAELRRQVTSPGGTTEAAVTVLDDRAVMKAFTEAIEAACRRSKELGS